MGLVLSLGPRARRRGFGAAVAAAAVAPPSSPAEIEQYKATAARADAVAKLEDKDTRAALIVAAIGISIGGSVALSASSREGQLAGAGVLGMGAAMLGAAAFYYTRGREAAGLRDAFASALSQVGETVYGIDSIPLTKGAG